MRANREQWQNESQRPRCLHAPAGRPAGEVTGQQLSDAIGGTSANRNAVELSDTPYDDPEKESLRQKLNELITAQRR